MCVCGRGRRCGWKGGGGIAERWPIFSRPWFFTWMLKSLDSTSMIHMVCLCSLPRREEFHIKVFHVIFCLSPPTQEGPESGRLI